MSLTHKNETDKLARNIGHAMANGISIVLPGTFESTAKGEHTFDTNHTPGFIYRSSLCKELLMLGYDEYEKQVAFLKELLPVTTDSKILCTSALGFFSANTVSQWAVTTGNKIIYSECTLHDINRWKANFETLQPNIWFATEAELTLLLIAEGDLPTFLQTIIVVNAINMDSWMPAFLSKATGKRLVQLTELDILPGFSFYKDITVIADTTVARNYQCIRPESWSVTKNGKKVSPLLKGELTALVHTADRNEPQVTNIETGIAGRTQSGNFEITLQEDSLLLSDGTLLCTDELRNTVLQHNKEIKDLRVVKSGKSLFPITVYYDSEDAIDAKIFNSPVAAISGLKKSVNRALMYSDDDILTDDSTLDILSGFLSENDENIKLFLKTDFSYESLHFPSYKTNKQDDNEQVVTTGPLALVEAPYPHIPEGFPFTLTGHLERVAAGKNNITFVHKDRSATTFSYNELLTRAKKLAGGLQSLNVAPQTPVLLQLDDQDSWITLYWAVLLNRLIAAPLAVPKVFTEENDTVQKLKNIIGLLDEPVVVCESKNYDWYISKFREWGYENIAVVKWEEIEQIGDAELPIVQPDDVALYMFTSGSTGLPKCIMQTHKALVFRNYAVGLHNNLGKDDVYLNWMPLDHIGGIQMSHNNAVVNGAGQISLPIEYVISNPVYWLDLIDTYRATYTWSPNFAFGLLQQEAETIRNGSWDLSCMRHWLTGGESVSAFVTRDVIELLKPHGLNEYAVFPAYGMSETCSGITHALHFDSKTTGLNNIVQSSMSSTLEYKPTLTDETVCLVEVGPPIPGVSIRITDRNNNILSENRIGLLQVTGPTITKGYLKNEEANQQLLADGWFNTGDLGFIRNGILTVTGREKDLIIINGLNYQNYEIERYIEELPEIGANAAIAAGYFDPAKGKELLHIFCKTSSKNYKDVAAKIRNVLVRTIGISPDVVVALREEDFLVTASGKKRRPVLLDAYRDEQLMPLYDSSKLKNPEYDNTLFFEEAWIEVPVVLAKQTNSTQWLVTDNAAVIADAKEKNVFDHVLTAAELKEYIASEKQVENIAICYAPAVVGNNTSVWTDEIVVLKTVFKNLKPASFCYFTSGLRAHAANATKFGYIPGMLQSIAEELEDVVVKWVDSDATTIDVLLQQYSAELADAARVTSVSYNNGKRYLQSVAPIANKGIAKEPAIKTNGFYLITGGFGGVGSFLLKKLVAHYNIKALVIGRTDFENKKLHGSIFGFEDRTTDRLAVYESLPQSNIIYRCCNIADKTTLQQIITETENNEGRQLDGYFHLAGVAKLAYHWEHIEEHLFTTEKAEVFDWMLQSKVKGTINLEEIFNERNSHFLRVVFGSVNAYFGANSFSTYAAVNSFIRFFTEEQNNKYNKCIHTIHWSQWKGLGMSEGNQLDALSANRGYSLVEPEEGWKAMLNVLRLAPGNYISGLQPANGFIENRTTFASSAQTLVVVCDPAVTDKQLQQIEKIVKTPLSSWKVVKTRKKSLFQSNSWKNIDLADVLPGSVEYTRVLTPTEQVLVDIWKELLAVDRVSVTDNFFQLGGHSIKATRMIARVKDRLKIQLPFSALFKFASLGDLAVHIESLNGDSNDILIPAAPYAALYALSPAQYRLWMVHKMEGGASAYLVPGIYDIEGSLDVTALQNALQALVTRHEILRTVFVEENSKPYQKILDGQPVDAYFTYWEKQDDVGNAIKTLIDKGFDLNGQLLFHCHVFKVKEGMHRMLVLLHHINADGVTLAVLRNDLVHFYAAFVQGKNVETDVQQIQYKDFSAWYNAFLDSDKAKEIKTFWLNKFSGSIPVLDMPADYPRPLKQSFKGDSVEVKLNPSLTQVLETIANEQKISLFAVLVSLVKTILWRHSGQDDVIVGTSVDLRVNSQLEKQAGQYVNVLALRDNLDTGLTFASLLKNVSDTLVSALENKLYPFEKLVSELDLPRDPGRNPLFSVLLVMHNFESSTGELTDTSWKPVHSNNDTSKFDYVFAFRKEEDGLLVNLRYCTDLFSQTRAEGLLADITALASGVSTNVNKGLKTYPLHTDEKILADGTMPFTPANFKDVISLFKQHVDNTPANIAVAYDNEQLSYKDLYARSLRYAALFQQVEGNRIVVAKSPSPDWLAVLLGIWISGKSYIPVDATFPVSTIVSQLQQVSPSAIVTDAATESAVKEWLQLAGVNIPVLTAILDDLQATIYADIARDDWAKEAYLVFTSGSTGVPKGIIGNRRSLSHFINWEVEMLGIKNKTGINVSQLTQPTFDASLRDIFLALTTGNTVVIPAQTIRKDLPALTSWLQDNKINIVHAVPSLLRALLVGINTSIDNSIKYILCAGEQLYTQDVNAIHSKLGNDVCVFNLYGATETTLIKTYWDTNNQWLLNALPAGRGINDCNIIILNEANVLCSYGEVGEVFIRTPYISNGYLNAQLNENSFIQNPLHDQYEDIVYRTGDVGRYTNNGVLQLAGRKDEQVKLNGVRVELKEIEQAARSVDGVQETVAKVWQQEEHTLVALYYTSAHITEDTLAAALKERLSAYAMPATIIKLDALPVNANGKVDKSALPALTQKANKGVGQTIQINEALLHAWAQALKISIPDVDTQKDFFRSGGNSLLAMILLAKVQQLFGVRVPIEDFFRTPTLIFLQTFAPAEIFAEQQSIKQIAKASSYKLSHAQQRMWILNEMESNNITYNVKRAFNLIGDVNISALKQSFETLLQKHETLRTSFHYTNGEVVQVVHDTYDIDTCFSYNDISEEANAAEQVQAEVEVLFAAPFRLDTYPLIKLQLLKTTGNKYVFAMLMHHIVSDGWSMEVIAKELIEIYNLITAGQKLSPVALPFQYKDFAAWQNEYLQNEQVKEDETYWLNKLSTLPEPLELPTDRPRVAIKTFNGDLYKFRFNKDLSQKLRRLSEDQQSTVFMVMLAAIKSLCYRYTGQEDIIIGTPTAGRRIPGIENQVGFYVNTLALRTQLDSKDSFKELLQKIKKTTLEGLEHQDYPFDTLVDKLQLKKRMDHSPLFDVVVQFMNTSVAKDKPATFNDIEVEPFEAKWHTSQFDQNFFFTETEDGIQGVVEFNTDLFDRSSVIRQVAHIQNFLAAVVENPSQPVSNVYFLTPEEQSAHKQLRDTNAGYPHNNLYEQFELAANKFPAKTALITTGGNRSYQTVKKNVGQLAALLQTISKGQNINVALLMDEGADAVEAMLATLKAGCCYVPVAVTFPYGRMKYLVGDCEAQVILFSKNYLKEAGKLYWECEHLKYAVCIDGDDIIHQSEPFANIMSEELWDFVGQSATDDITGGAWFSSYNGLPISRLEMDEYAQNAYAKLKPYLSKDKRVLEVGCASAITMSVLAPHVQHYTGADLSANILEIANKNLGNAGITNYDLVHASAHDVCNKISGTYDVLVFNSVIQCFSGYNYLRNVIESLLPFLSDNAVILFGDIQDLDKKEALEESLRAYSVEHTSNKVKLDWSQELFIPRRFFDDLVNYFPAIKNVTHSAKTGTVENELTLFRYDTVVEINKSAKVNKQISKTWFDTADIDTAVAPKEMAQPGMDTPAYIIYTSGSTGNPKGCVITHRNLIRLFFNDKMQFNFTENDVWIQSHGYHFDFSVWEIYGALLYGGSLVIPTRQEIRDISTYYNLLKQHRVTVLNNTPRAFYNFSQYILQTNDPHDISTHLRYVIFGGEKLQPDRLLDWMKRFPGVDMINMYGITETTVHVTYHKITAEEIQDNPYASIIGHPIPETSVYLKDAWGNDVPFNVAAEMNIGGTGVSTGYFNRAELTAEKFADNLYGDDNRIYHSGDFGKLLPDGNLVYVNRRDAQVKIRGYRIETGEIESVLLKYPDIRQAAVVVKTDKAGDNSLVAYFTGQQAEQEALRKFVAMYLPSYTVPSAFIYLDELPVTINGKLDVKRLPEPGTSAHVQQQEDEQELTPTEQMVRNAFCEVLSLEYVGMTDNFFELGGHSLKAMSLMSLMHSRIKVGVPLVYLYKFPTAKEIAHYIDCARYMNIQYKEHPYIQLGDPDGKRTVILFPPALGSALAYGHLASLLPDTRLFSFNYVDNNDTMHNYVRLLNEIQPEGELYIAGHSAGGFMAFHVAKAMENAGRKVGGIIILDAFRQGKEGKYHTYETIMEGVDQYLAYKFNEYKDHFIDMDFFKEVCYNQVKQYYDFLFHAEKAGDIFIQAPIHFMIAENNYERQENWTPCTAGGVKVYYSSGIHGKMVDEPWVRPNAEIINNIIQQQNITA